MIASISTKKTAGNVHRQKTSTTVRRKGVHILCQVCFDKTAITPVSTTQNDREYFLRRREALGRNLDKRPSWRTRHPDEQQLIQAGSVRQHMSTAVLATDMTEALHTPLPQTTT